jgi:hypothetical protein
MDLGDFKFQGRFNQLFGVDEKVYCTSLFRDRNNRSRINGGEKVEHGRYSSAWIHAARLNLVLFYRLAQTEYGFGREGIRNLLWYANYLVAEIFACGFQNSRTVCFNLQGHTLGGFYGIASFEHFQNAVSKRRREKKITSRPLNVMSSNKSQGGDVSCMDAKEEKGIVLASTKDEDASANDSYDRLVEHGGIVLKELILKYWKQQKYVLAHRAEIQESRLHKIVSGLVKPKLTEFVRIVEAINDSPDFLESALNSLYHKELEALNAALPRTKFFKRLLDFLPKVRGS